MSSLPSLALLAKPTALHRQLTLGPKHETESAQLIGILRGILDLLNPDNKHFLDRVLDHLTRAVNPYSADESPLVDHMLDLAQSYLAEWQKLNILLPLILAYGCKDNTDGRDKRDRDPDSDSALAIGRNGLIPGVRRYTDVSLSAC